MKRVIFHVDVNSAFLSWEACYRIHHLGGAQDLRNLVSAVGGDQEKRHGIILAKSIPAKKYKIQTGVVCFKRLLNQSVRKSLKTYKPTILGKERIANEKKGENHAIV